MEISNKQRILTLREIFKQQTDENHPFSLDDIYEKMILEIGPDFEVNMKSIRNDIDSLSNSG